MGFASSACQCSTPRLPSGAPNEFVAAHRVLSVDRQLITAGASPAWAVCVTYTGGSEELMPKKAPRVDYKQVLSEEDFAVYAKLRDLRKSMADHDAVSVYAIASNEQLAAMVTQRVSTVEAFGEIDGMGPARLGKYAGQLLDVLRSSFGGSPARATATTPSASGLPERRPKAGARGLTRASSCPPHGPWRTGPGPRRADRRPEGAERSPRHPSFSAP